MLTLPRCLSIFCSFFALLALRNVAAADLAGLPIAPGAERPTVVLDLGKNPISIAPMQQIRGTLMAHTGTGGLIEEQEETQVLHPGFGDFGAHFRFELKPSLPPGQYRFFARYKSGGEVSQVTQTFTLKAGGDTRALATRGAFTLLNTTPWEYQWQTGAGTVAILPGDRFLDIENAGKGDGAKVFDAFMLQLEHPLQAWMSTADAELRNRFLAQTRKTPHAERLLYVLDGPGAHGAVLFRGLSGARQGLDQFRVEYLIGPDAEAMARALNLPTLPVALIADDHYSLLGMLAAPKTEADVARFLADPARHGSQPAIPQLADETPQALRDGVPAAWLVGGVQDGVAGVSLYGLDTETVLRPNPQQPYFSSEMMGGRMRAWHGVPATPEGDVTILESTDHDYRWSRGTGYGQLYLHATEATQTRLRLSPAEVSNAVWLDGKPVGWFKDGAELNLTPGWHSLLLKRVMRLDQGQRFAYTARLTDRDGKPANAITTRTSDPAADGALNRIAGKLRPLVYVDAPANLPRPGDPLKVRVDLRWHPLMEEKTLPAPLPRFRAKLRLQIQDYRGRQAATREIEGFAEFGFCFARKPGDDIGRDGNLWDGRARSLRQFAEGWQGGFAQHAL